MILNVTGTSGKIDRPFRKTARGIPETHRRIPENGLNKRDDKGMSFSKNFTENDCSTRLHSLNYKCYDFLRDDPEFKQIKEELEKNAK